MLTKIATKALLKFFKTSERMVQKATKRKQKEVKTGNEMEGLFSRFSNEFEGQNSLRSTLVETGG